MGKIIISCFLFAGLFATANVDAQVRKIDTSGYQGNIGYRVWCNNKNAGENDVSVSPKGFDKEVRDLSFPVRGRLRKILVEDVNEDGYPDLLLCIYGGANGEMGTIAGISSSGNASLVPVRFPDIYSDSKLSEGYKGHDEFSDLTGTLLRKFPIYLPADTLDKATGGTRVVQYKAMKDNGHLAFKVLRSYDVKQ